MSAFTVFGLHTATSLAYECAAPDESHVGVSDQSYNRDAFSASPRVSALVYNVLNIAGYCPGAGVLTCVARIVLSREGEKNNYFYALIGRAVVEFFGLGIVFLIPDIVISVQRHCCNRDLIREV